MAKLYDYVLAVWLHLAASRAAPEFLEELREYLEAEYQIIKLEVVEESESDEEGELPVSLQLQLTFDESQMDGDDPTEEALGELDRALRPYLEAKYQVNYLEILDDALTSYLLAERDEPEQRKYPEPKQRDLTDDEKTQLRARIERGDGHLCTRHGVRVQRIAGRRNQSSHSPLIRAKGVSIRLNLLPTPFVLLRDANKVKDFLP